MKLAGVLFVAGLMLSVVGAALLLMTEDIELVGDEILLVPEGQDGYVYLEIDMGTGGPIAGTYECLNGTPVQVSVMDQGQFEDFLDGLEGGSRTTVLGLSGDFSVEQVDMETCYIMVEHAAGMEAEQSVRIEYTVTNTDYQMTFASTVVFVAGGVMVTSAFHPRLRGRAKAQQMVATGPIDVVFFDE